MYLLGAVIVGIIGYKVYDLMSITDARKSKNKAFYIKLFCSKSTTALKDIVNILFNSMADFGTKETRMFDILSGLNKHDLIYIYNEFGMRPYSLGGLNRITGKDMNLIEWFNEELDDEDYSRMHEIWKDAIQMGDLNWIKRS